MAPDETCGSQRFDVGRNLARPDESRAHFCRRGEGTDGGIARNPDDRGMELDAASR